MNAESGACLTYNALSASGSGINTLIYVGGIQVAFITTLSDYLGKSFTFSYGSSSYSGTFANGDVYL
jgi:hypothetical protein